MNRKLFKSILSLALALLMVMVIPVQAVAREWKLEDGSVEIHADESGQIVKQGDNEKPDSSPVITGSYTGDGPAIDITTDNATAQLTIENVSITPASGSAIEVGDSNAVIQVNGTNQVDGHAYPEGTYLFGGDEGAAIHVTSGNLEITSENGGVLNMTVSGSSAAIGGNGSLSYASEDMGGTIEVSGDVQLNITNNSLGAGIGSGLYGTVSGDIIVSENAEVSFDGSTKYCIGTGAGNAGVAQESEIKLQDNASVEMPKKGIIGAEASNSGSFEIEGTASVNGQYGSDAVNNSKVLFKDSNITAEEPKPPETNVPAPGGRTKPVCSAVYQVVDEEEIEIYFQASLNDGVLTVTAFEDYAQFKTSARELKLLQSWSITTIRFVSKNAVSQLSLEDLAGDIAITHEGQNRTLHVDGAENNELLK